MDETSAAVRFIQSEIDSKPTRIAPDGIPAVEHYLVVLAALKSVK
jgi:hypothetical protein